MTRDPEIPRSRTGHSVQGTGPVHAHALAHRASRCPSYEVALHSGAPPKQARVAPWNTPLTGEPGTVDDPAEGPDASSNFRRARIPLPHMCT